MWNVKTGDPSSNVSGIITDIFDAYGSIQKTAPAGKIVTSHIGYGIQIAGAAMAIPPYSITRDAIYALAATHSSLRVPIDVLLREVTLNGFEVVPNYEYKCDNPECGYEYTEKPGEAITECIQCGSKELSTPSAKNRMYAEEYLTKEWNVNRQHILDIVEEGVRDLATIDDAYMYIKTEYKDFNNKITEKEVIGYMMLRPPTVYLITDMTGETGKTPRGKFAYVCVRHRDRIIELDGKGPNTPPDDPRCPICNLEALPAAVYVFPEGVGISGYGGLVNDTRSAFILAQEEIIMTHGYSMRSRAYGLPKAITAINMIQAVAGVELYLNQVFDLNRPPKSLVMIATRNIEQTQKRLKVIRERLKKDPNEIPILLIQAEQGMRKMVEQVNLMGTFQDIQLSEMIFEFRKIIASLYGVTPIYEGEVSRFAGQSMEVAISNKAVMQIQQFYEETFFRAILQRRGIYDHSIIMRHIEVSDEIRDVELKVEKAEYARRMAELGYGHRLDGNGEFIFDNEPDLTPKMPGGAISGPGSTNNIPNEGTYRPNSERTNNQGQPAHKRSSDVGGSAQGAPDTRKRSNVGKR